MAIIAPPSTRSTDLPRQSSNGKSRRGDTLAATLLITPGLVAFIMFVIVPALGGLVLAFFSWDLFGTPKFASSPSSTASRAASAASRATCSSSG